MSLILVWTSCLGFNISFAQTPEEVFNNYYKDWYQVELIVFERIENTSAAPEAWPKNISLVYPPNLEFFAKESPTDMRIIDQANDNRELLQQLRLGRQDDPINKKIIDSIEKSELERVTPDEQPFVQLPKENNEMNDEARRLGRNQVMRILFHESWRQPIVEQKKAKAIVMTGGDAFDTHFELEGTITLFVSRYLHLHTNLWLTQFDANFGQETKHWPILPERPSPLQFSEEPLEEINNESLSNTGWSLSTVNNNNFAFGDDIKSIGTIDILGDYANLTQKPFVVTHIVTMVQKRRMRSSELHYLDHPRMGILIKIDKYKPSFEAINPVTSQSK